LQSYFDLTIGPVASYEIIPNFCGSSITNLARQHRTAERL